MQTTESITTYAEMVRQGGVVLVAIVVFVVLMVAAVIVLFQRVGHPTLEGLSTITGNLKEASEHNAKAAEDNRVAASTNMAAATLLKQQLETQTAITSRLLDRLGAGG